MHSNSYSLIRDTPNGDVVRIDISWASEKGTISDFSMNVSILEDENKIDVYRIDTNHGYLHEHKFWKSEKPEKVNLSYKEAFIRKKKEIIQNYKRWVFIFKKRKSEYHG
jgi:hypothetical protein